MEELKREDLNITATLFSKSQNEKKRGGEKEKMKVMQLNKILDEIISKEVYKEVKVECKLPYHPFELKTLLSLYEGQGKDIHDPDVFDEIVEKARQDLGEEIKNHNEERLNHFATLFKEAIDKDLVIG